MRILRANLTQKCSFLDVLTRVIDDSVVSCLFWATCIFRESRGGSSFATRKYLRSLVYPPSTTSSDIVASPSSATSPDCRIAPQHIKPYSLTSTSHSVVFPIPPGVVGLVAHVADGSTKSETTPARHLPTSEDRPLDAVIMDERRDGPRWLCADDDDVYLGL